MLEQKLRTILEEKLNKITPYNIRKGVKVFDVEGTYTAPVALYNSVSEMQADVDEPNGEIGVVLEDTKLPISSGEAHHFVTFPATVTLDTALTSYTLEILGYRASISTYGNAQRFSFVIEGETEELIITYTSTDGLNYTSSKGEDVVINLGETLTFTNTQGAWDAGFSKFLLADHLLLRGVYDYVEEYDEATSTFTKRWEQLQVELPTE